MIHEPEPNSLFRAARRWLSSQAGDPRPLSRQELADADNACLRQEHDVHAGINRGGIARLELGYVRWPLARNRLAFRAGLGASTEDELGFHPSQRCQV